MTLVLVLRTTVATTVLAEHGKRLGDLMRNQGDGPCDIPLANEKGLSWPDGSFLFEAHVMKRL